MKGKLKIVGAVALGSLCIGSLIAGSAGAEGGGDFDLGEGAVVVKGFQDAEHFIESGSESGAQSYCNTGVVEGEVTEGTLEAIALFAGSAECYTTGSPKNTFSYHQNGCYLTLTVGREAEKDNTAYGVCPKGPAEITHPNCVIEVPAQTVSSVSYDSVELEGKHAITLTVTTEKITSHYEGGICQLLGTTHSTSLNGSAILQAFNEVGEPVDLTATGSEE